MKIVSSHQLENSIQRTSSRALEQKQQGALQAIAIADLIPEEAKGKYGTFKITVEFEPNDE